MTSRLITVDMFPSTGCGCTQNRSKNPIRRSWAGFFSESGRKRVVRYCDGWMPNFAAMEDPDIAKAFSSLRQQMEEAGRDPASLSLGMWTLPDEMPDEEKLQAFKTAGVQRVIMFAPVEGSDKVLPFLDHYAELIPKLA